MGYAEGGVARFYRGLAPGLIQAPMARFGDTAANDGTLAALEHPSLPTAAKTMAASGCAAAFRVVLMPIDAWKTTKQVEGADGLKKLIEKTKKHPTALWQGAVGAMTATWVGHFPWFYTNNQLRVLKTTRQTSMVPVSYMESAKAIIDKEGVAGLFGRGLKTRILTNGIQGALFTIGWKAISEMLNK